MAKPEDSLSRRVLRFADVGTNVGTLALRLGAERYLGIEIDRQAHAEELRKALGGLKGPIMKVAQMLATIPDAVPAEYAAELAKLQSNAPSMGWPFVRRRMAAELGADWQTKFAAFEPQAAAAASLGQVHRAMSHDGTRLACKLQYPDMDAAVASDLSQLQVVFRIQRSMNKTVDTRKIEAEIGARLREELNYDLEARHIALYRLIFNGSTGIHVPGVMRELSTQRLLTMTWLDGAPLMDFKSSDQDARNRIAANLFQAWWYPFSHYGVIHGDPHLGNYTITPDHSLNLLDYGCIRSFRPRFVQGVVDLYRALEANDEAQAVHAFETWGFENLTKDMIDVLSLWARFIYGPMLDDRTRTIADGIAPGDYGRQEAAEVQRRLRLAGAVTPPHEFVFMDRAAIGLGGVFLHLDAKLNWYRMFNETIAQFDLDVLHNRQSAAFAQTGVPLPV
jgi:predicted unusual protein kinase regulating ubiquinone biosynthesis (AarF/ABC1/UbiB family)